jgi:hypothetical protein
MSDLKLWNYSGKKREYTGSYRYRIAQ